MEATDRTHLGFMRLALAQAEEAASAGEVPVGAVLVRDGRTIAVGHNLVMEEASALRHAEMVVLASGARAVGDRVLTGSTLYVTLEPCPMCAGAIILSRVSRVIFGAPDPKWGSCGSLYNLCVDPRLNHEVEVTPGVLAADSSELLKSFFAIRRRDGLSL